MKEGNSDGLTKEEMMDELDVRIVHLEPMRVASALGFGPNPEEQAWDMLMTWARSNGLLEMPGTRFIGFNNPNPSPGSPNYGYEQWMTVGPGVEGNNKIEMKEFPGGRYAVVRWNGIPNPTIWGRLVRWVENSAYRMVAEQCLEECLDPVHKPQEEWVFDLYLPIAE